MRAVAAAWAASVCLASLFIVADAHADSAKEIEACNSKDPDTAIKGCTSLIDGKKLNKLKPLLGAVYAQRAQAYLIKMDYDDALADASKCTELDPKSAPCWLTKALLYDQKFQHDEALTAYTKHLDLSPKDKSRCDGLLLRADAYSRRSLWESAFDMAKTAKDLPKDAPPPELTPEQKQKRDRDIQAAETDASECVTLDPLNDAAYLKRGMYRNQLGRHDEGFADYAKAYEINPKNADALSYLATNAFNRQDHARAAELAGKWVELVPNDLSVQDLYADALIKVGRAAEGDKLKKLVTAKRDCSKAGDLSKLQQSDHDTAISGCAAIIATPDVEKAWLRLAYELRGSIFGLKSQYAEAVNDYTSALEITDNPASRAVYLENRGGYYVALTQWDNAISDLNASLAAGPGTPRALYFRAIAYRNKGDLEKAQNDFIQVVAQEPANANAWAHLGDMSFAQSKFDAAADYYGKLIALTPGSAVAYEARGKSFENLGRKEEAKTDYRKAIELDPKRADSIAGLARLEGKAMPAPGPTGPLAGNLESCNAAYDAAYQGKETNLDEGIVNCTAVVDAPSIDQGSLIAALEARGQLHSYKQSFDAAVSDFTRCIELTADTDKRAIYYAQRAYNLITQGQHERGIADLDQSLKDKPDDSRNIEMRGVAYFQLGQMDKARTDFTKVVELDPKSNNALTGLGDIERLGKNCNAALPHYNKVVELSPTAMTGYLLRALCYEDLGSKEEAVADYRQTLKLNPGQQDSLDGLKRLGAAP